MTSKYTFWKLDCGYFVFPENQLMVVSSWFTGKKKKKKKKRKKKERKRKQKKSNKFLYKNLSFKFFFHQFSSVFDAYNHQSNNKN